MQRCLIFLSCLPLVASFLVNSPTKQTRYYFTGETNRRTSTEDSSISEQWMNLVEDKDNVIKKLILQSGTEGSVPEQGSQVEISYVGTLGGSQSEWSVDDVIECWLQYQQGLNDILEQPFREKNIDGKILMDDTTFTEEFVANDLGVTNKMQCKKTIMAAKRLWKQMEEFPKDA